MTVLSELLKRKTGFLQEQSEMRMDEIHVAIKRLVRSEKMLGNVVNEHGGNQTLSFSANAAKFEAEVIGENIVIIMGPTKQTLMKFKLNDVDKIIAHFKQRDWFRFDGSMERTVPGGLRHFFETELKRPPKLASHVAAWMVHKGLLEHRHSGSRNVVEMRVIKGA